MFFIFIPTFTEQILCVVIMIAKEDAQSKKSLLFINLKYGVCARECVCVNVCVCNNLLIYISPADLGGI